MPRVARRLLPPLWPTWPAASALFWLAASALLWPSGRAVAQGIDPEPSPDSIPDSLPEADIRCERLGIRFMMVGGTIYGTCEYRLCRFIDEDGYAWTVGGAPITYFEADCGLLGTHAPDDDTPGAS